MAHGLSKSRLIEWRQCPKRLWLKVNHPELLETTDQSERAFQIGYQVGDVAQQLHPGGVLIEGDNLKDALRLTKELLANQPNVPLYEATFERDGVLVRADLLLPGKQGYRMVEVKAATSVKDYYLEDAAIQRWVVGDAVQLAEVEVAHVDNTFVYLGGGDYEGLLNYVAVNEETLSISGEVPAWVSDARKTLANSEEPAIQTGKQCNDPFECPFIGYCNTGKPQTEYPLNSVPHLTSRKREQLELQGILDVRQIPEDYPLTDTQERVRRVTRAGKAELLSEAAEELAPLPWPRYYLDFETVSMPVPIWAGTHPYQKIPVQWSCHVEIESGQLTHSAFLAEGLDDPRRAFSKSMIDSLGAEGPIFVYNQSFELGRIAELARDFPDLSEPLMSISERVVDLLPLTRRSYYHPAMRGSWSIKAVLPTIAADLDYQAMAVADGGAAEGAWLEIFHPETPEHRRQTLIESLSEYCALDTMAMVRLAAFLQGKSGE
jgi:hypothetical protein